MTARALRFFGGSSPSPRPDDGGNRDERRLAQLGDPFVMEADEPYFTEALDACKDYYLRTIRRPFELPPFYWAAFASDMRFADGNSGYPIFEHSKPDEGPCLIIEKEFFQSLTTEEREAFLARYIAYFVPNNVKMDLREFITYTDQQAVIIGGLNAAISSLEKEFKARAEVGMVTDGSLPSIEDRTNCMRSFAQNVIELRRHNEQSR